jgi:DNA polymerase-3 subunit chi
MPRIDFYVLSGVNPTGRQAFVCRLTEKAVAQGHKVYIHNESREQALMLDELLWTFKDIGFIPHALGDDPQAAAVPVVLGHGAAPQSGSTGVLINLDMTVPAFFERFERVTELVDQSAAVKQGARERFRFYKERGFSPQTHHL